MSDGKPFILIQSAMLTLPTARKHWGKMAGKLQKQSSLTMIM